MKAAFFPLPSPPQRPLSPEAARLGGSVPSAGGLRLGLVDQLSLGVDRHGIALHREGITIPADDGPPLAGFQRAKDVVHAQNAGVRGGDDAQCLCLGVPTAQEVAQCEEESLLHDHRVVRHQAKLHP